MDATICIKTLQYHCEKISEKSFVCNKELCPRSMKYTNKRLFSSNVDNINTFGRYSTHHRTPSASSSHSIWPLIKNIHSKTVRGKKPHQKSLFGWDVRQRRLMNSRLTKLCCASKLPASLTSYSGVVYHWLLSPRAKSTDSVEDRWHPNSLREKALTVCLSACTVFTPTVFNGAEQNLSEQRHNRTRMVCSRCSGTSWFGLGGVQRGSSLSEQSYRTTGCVCVTGIR